MFFPLVSFTQNTQQELETITNPYKTNSKNIFLQELLNEDELALESKLNSYAFFEGESHQLKGDINLTNSKTIIRKGSPKILPYWKINGSEKIILIMSGNGLWDRIGGYILVNKNSNIIENIVFNHKSETPGLGAEISKRSFEEKFIGLKLNQTHTFLIKKVSHRNTPNNEHPNDLEDINVYPIEGLSGASITTSGVQDMLNKTIENYSELLKTN